MKELPPRLRQAGHEVVELDRAVYAAVHATPTPQVDLALARISRAADRSLLWMGVAAALAVSGQRRRRAAMVGMGAIGATSATVNLPTHGCTPGSTTPATSWPVP